MLSSTSNLSPWLFIIFLFFVSGAKALCPHVVLPSWQLSFLLFLLFKANCNSSSILEESTSSELRSRVYELRNKIASYDTKYDNSNNIKSIVQKRQEIATLLGKKDYTEVVIQDRMAKNANEIIALLNNFFANLSVRNSV